MSGGPRIAAVVVALGAIVYAQPAAAPYARDARVAYLGAALDAIGGLGDAGRRDLERAIYQGVRDRCRAAQGTPAVACTIEVARAICGPRPDAAACDVAADVIATNQRAETELVEESTRMRLIGATTDYHTAVLAELEVRHGALAAELVLADPTPLGRANLPARIDRLCRYRDRGPDWQRCAAALVWYAGAHLEERP